MENKSFYFMLPSAGDQDGHAWVWGVQSVAQMADASTCEDGTVRSCL